MKKTKLGLTVDQINTPTKKKKKKKKKKGGYFTHFYSVNENNDLIWQILKQKYLEVILGS